MAAEQPETGKNAEAQGKEEKGKGEKVEIQTRPKEQQQSGLERAERRRSPAELARRLLRRWRPDDTFDTALARRMSNEMDRIFSELGFPERRASRRFGLVGPEDLWSMSPLEMMRMASDFGYPGEMIAPLATVDWAPQIEVFERGDELVVQADVPGMKKEDLSIDIVDNNLVVEGERRFEDEEQGRGYYRSERSYGQFRRVIPLPEGANVHEAKASFADGVLEIRVKHPQRGRRIEITSGEKPEEGKAEVH